MDEKIPEQDNSTKYIRVTSPQHSSNRKIWIAAIMMIMFVSVAGMVYAAFQKGSVRRETAKNITEIKSPEISETTETNASAVSPTPFPFQELTIPYLRERTYSSNLDVLELVQTNSSYRTYTTKYISDGYTIHGLLTQPAGEPPSGGWPTVVFVHGYIPPAQYETLGSPYAAYVDYIARSGFVVFKIDLRGHGISEGEPGGGYYGSDYVVDTLSAYSALQASSFVNPEKIGLWGHSMAGNILLRSLAVKKNIPAAVIWAGAVFTYEDMQKYSINDASYSPPSNDTERQRKRKLLFDTHGQFRTDNTFWKQVAPTMYLGDITGAIELHHAVDDPVVNIGYSRDLNLLLDKTSAPHALHEYSSGGHNISGENFNSAMARTVEFFKKYLN